ncbi:MAG: hypothetical protein SGJ13_13465 [Actinomycetota bacterium]|nr:hypothetical protein [Actinomycetota bacterium]
MPDQAELESEREFLLRSLDDLDTEHDAGNMDDDTYSTLHGDYTARAAAVIRAIESASEPAVPKPAPPVRWMQIVTVVGVIAFALSAAFLLTRAVGTRGAGQTATGNSQAAEDPTETLRAAAVARPDDYEARMAYARVLLSQDRVRALAEYDAAADLDPTQPEPITYAGWIIGLAAQGSEPGPDRDLLVTRALERLDAATALDPNYADAFVFRGILEFNVVGDAAGSVPDFQAFLALAPDDHPMRETVLDTLARAISASETSPTTGGP